MVYFTRSLVSDYTLRAFVLRPHFQRHAGIRFRDLWIIRRFRDPVLQPDSTNKQKGCIRTGAMSIYFPFPFLPQVFFLIKTIFDPILSTFRLKKSYSIN